MKINLSYVWILAWAIIFLANLKVGFTDSLCNKGFHLLDNQYYRLFSGLLLHRSWFHLLANATTLFWLGRCLDGKISTIRLCLFTVLVGIITNAIFSTLYPDSTSIGGSPVVFAMIALLCLLQLYRKEMPLFRFGTWSGNWTAVYVVLSNIPLFSQNSSTLVVHLIAFVAALVLGYAGIKLNIL